MWHSTTLSTTPSCNDQGPMMDPFRLGVTIVMVGLDLCLLAAILPNVALPGTLPGPMFCQFLTRERLSRRCAIYYTQRYSGHSFWIRVATTAAQDGLEDHTIQTLGLWHSSAYLAYIRLPREFLAPHHTGHTKARSTVGLQTLAMVLPTCLSLAAYLLTATAPAHTPEINLHVF